jgi:Ser/Thr protein kinase RdoA (MazF antagonist)
MPSDPTPQFTLADAVRIAREVFGLAVTAAVLPSERDQNFLLAVPCGDRHVLKIAKADEERSVLEFQNAALAHVARRAPGLALPRLQRTRGGAHMERIRDGRGRWHFIRLIGWLEGRVYAEALPHGAALLASLGSVIGELDRALQDFSHAAMHRQLGWDLKCADLALEHLALLTPEQQQVVRQLAPAWQAIDWNGLRRGVIHGDANDHNVLVRDGSVVGIIDFGDIVHSAVACDPAIAVAYAMLDQARPLDAAAAIMRAYHARFPLRTAEIDAIYPLVTARLCMSLCYAAYNARAKSGDVYQQVTAGPAWILLQRLAQVPPASARSMLRDACREH